MNRLDIPEQWKRLGIIIPRTERGNENSVAGDPCIVWDEELPGWRMVLFYDPSGHAQAICRTPHDVGPGHWEQLGPLEFENPQEMLGGMTHKPFIVMEAHAPNRAALVNGQYWLLTVSYSGGHKVVQRASAGGLGGPWRFEPGALIDTGPAGAFDSRHVDAVTGYYFPEREAFLYYYMGYPDDPQERTGSLYGSAQGAALQYAGAAVRPAGASVVEKLGVILSPCEQAGHWASGWVGGLQLLPGKQTPWIAILNASPTAPRRDDTSISREEPPPSLGGFATCREEWPVRGWEWQPGPLEWIENIPEAAVRAGEGVNLWRQHILCLPSGEMVLYYNSGTYGREQLFAKISAK